MDVNNAARLVFLGLRNMDSEDAILERSRHTILIHTVWEIKASREIADAALADPVLGIVGGFLRRYFNGALLHGFLFSLVTNGSLVRFATLGYRGRGLPTALDGTGGRSAGGVRALNVAANHHRLWVNELDAQILLGHAGKLAVQLVGGISLADVKPRRKRREVAAVTMAIAGSSAPSIRVEVIEEAEERSEARILGSVEAGAWKEGHLAFCGDWFEVNLLQNRGEPSKRGSAR